MQPGGAGPWLVAMVWGDGEASFAWPMAQAVLVPQGEALKPLRALPDPGHHVRGRQGVGTPPGEGGPQGLLAALGPPVPGGKHLPCLPGVGPAAVSVDRGGPAPPSPPLAPAGVWPDHRLSPTPLPPQGHDLPQHPGGEGPAEGHRPPQGADQQRECPCHHPHPGATRELAPRPPNPGC